MIPSIRRQRAARLALLAGALLHLLFLVSLPTGILNPLFVESNEGLKQASDFFGIYQAGANLVGGHSIYDSDNYRNEAPRRVPFFYFYRYLPPTACVFAPITLALPPWPAYWLWVVVCELILLLLIRSTLRQTEWPQHRRLIVAALWLGFFPFYLEQVMGQFSIVMAAFLWMLWRHDPARRDAIQPDPDRGRGNAASRREADAARVDPERSAETVDLVLRHQEHQARNGSGRGSGPLSHLAALGGILLRRWRAYSWRNDRVGSPGLLLGWIGGLSLKSFAALLLVPYLRDRRVKLALAGIGATVALSAPYFLARPADLREFARLNFSPFTPTLHKGSFGLHNLLRELVSRIDHPVSAQLLQAGPLQLSLLSGTLLLAFAVIGLLAVLASLRLLEHRNRTALDLAIWTAAFFLVFKSVWEYHYVMLLPAVAALYLTTGSRFVLTLGILLGLPTLYPLAPLLAGVARTSSIESWPGWFSALHLSVKSLPTLALFLWCLRETGRGRQASPPEVSG